MTALRLSGPGAFRALVAARRGGRVQVGTSQPDADAGLVPHWRPEPPATTPHGSSRARLACQPKLIAARINYSGRRTIHYLRRPSLSQKIRPKMGSTAQITTDVPSGNPPAKHNAWVGAEGAAAFDLRSESILHEANRPGVACFARVVVNPLLAVVGRG